MCSTKKSGEIGSFFAISDNIYTCWNWFAYNFYSSSCLRANAWTNDCFQTVCWATTTFFKKFPGESLNENN